MLLSFKHVSSSDSDSDYQVSSPEVSNININEQEIEKAENCVEIEDLEEEDSVEENNNNSNESTLENGSRKDTVLEMMTTCDDEIDQQWVSTIENNFNDMSPIEQKSICYTLVSRLLRALMYTLSKDERCEINISEDESNDVSSTEINSSYKMLTEPEVSDINISKESYNVEIGIDNNCQGIVDIEVYEFGESDEPKITTENAVDGDKKGISFEEGLKMLQDSDEGEFNEFENKKDENEKLKNISFEEGLKLLQNSDDDKKNDDAFESDEDETVLIPTKKVISDKNKSKSKNKGRKTTSKRTTKKKTNPAIPYTVQKEMDDEEAETSAVVRTLAKKARKWKRLARDRLAELQKELEFRDRMLDALLKKQ